MRRLVYLKSILGKITKKITPNFATFYFENRGKMGKITDFKKILTGTCVKHLVKCAYMTMTIDAIVFEIVGGRGF